MERTEKEQRIRRRLKAIIRVLSGITAIGLIGGVVLVSKIFGSSGWHISSAPSQNTSGEDKYITGVLIAVQNSPLHTPDAAADMIFAVSFNAIRQELTAAAIAPGMLSDDNITTMSDIYAKDGPDGLLNAVNSALGLNIDSYACTDTASLAAMIDLLGGINASLSLEEAGYINSALSTPGAVSPGAVKLNGIQAMIHAMDGISDGLPLGQLQRSLGLISSAVANMRATATKEAMLPLLALVMSSIDTNLNMETLKDFAYEILKSDELTMNILAVPVEGSWKYTNQAGESISYDPKVNKEAILMLIKGE